MSLSENVTIPKSSTFIIPKLNGGGSSTVSPNLTGESLTPHEVSLKKIMDLKRLNITKDTENSSSKTDNNFMATTAENELGSIDLASALNGPNFRCSISEPIKRVVESIDFKFIDCDIAEVANVEPLVTQDCCINISKILDKHFENRTKSTTAFGKILCSKYKCKKQLTVQHGFVSKHQIKPFRFDSKVLK